MKPIAKVQECQACLPPKWPKNVIITLNCDVLVEEALGRFDIPVSYKLGGTGVEINPEAGIDESKPNSLQV